MQFLQKICQIIAELRHGRICDPWEILDPQSGFHINVAICENITDCKDVLDELGVLLSDFLAKFAMHTLIVF